MSNFVSLTSTTIYPLKMGINVSLCYENGGFTFGFSVSFK